MKYFYVLMVGVFVGGVAMIFLQGRGVVATDSIKTPDTLTVIPPTPLCPVGFRPDTTYRVVISTGEERRPSQHFYFINYEGGDITEYLRWNPAPIKPLDTVVSVTTMYVLPYR